MYLSKVLDSEKNRWKSFDKLAQKIREANKEQCGVDRRKLKKIVIGDEVSLTLAELRALDTYLTPLGEGLGDKPLFEKQRILEAFAETGDVTFLLGAMPGKPQEEMRTIISHWDVESMAEILRGVYSFRTDIRFDIKDLLLPKKRGDSGWDSENELGNLLRDDGPSICCIGSPRSCYATEIILAKMFEIDPYIASAESLPFYFYWPLKFLSKTFSSAFTVDKRRLACFRTIQCIGEEDMAINVLDIDQAFVANKTKKTIWEDYGVFVAQRRKTGRIWLVIAGLTGPTTYATAKAVRSTIETAAPARKYDGHSEILWGIISTEIRINTHSSGDKRDIVADPRLRLGPRYWSPPQRVRVTKQ